MPSTFLSAKESWHSPRFEYVQFTRVLADEDLAEIGLAGYELVGFSETDSTIRYIFVRKAV